MKEEDEGEDLTPPELRQMVDDTVERLRRQAHIVGPLRIGKERPPGDVARRLETIRRLLQLPDAPPGGDRRAQ